MTSALVLVIASILHFGFRSSIFLSIEGFPVIPGTGYSGHLAYCALLHFLYDAELLPQRYRRRMMRLASFLIELVLGVAVMEFLGLWMWCNVEHICHMLVKYILKNVGMSPQFYMEWEWAIMGGLMTSLALLFCASAFTATDGQAARPAATAGITAGRHPSNRRRPRRTLRKIMMG